MAELDLEQTILIVVGISLRAEKKDRVLAYRLSEEAQRLLEQAESAWQTRVITDVLYLNTSQLTALPTISFGGPGVNKLSGMLYEELPYALAIDHTLLIQMDVDMNDQRCCIWGMDHDLTVEALDLFIQRGYLVRYLQGVTGLDHIGDT